MSFCGRCNDLVTFLRAELEASTSPLPEIQYIYPQSTAIFRLDIKVSLGCSLCALIFNQITEDNLTDLLQLDEPFINIRSTPLYLDPGHRLKYVNIIKPMCDSLELSFCHPQGRDLFKGQYPVSVIADNTSKITIHQYVSSNTDSPLSWHLAREWLKKCSASHPCTLKMDKRFPSRLIQVTGTSRADLRARLVLSAGLGANTKYCTLSHCWGSSPIIKLQKANLVGFLSDIPIFELSKTFQDAMYAVIQLGFSFIWIDSLCIIQDRREDWLHEASLMSSVYANSSLNLAATAAADGRAGLFFSRNPASIKAGYITASGALRNGYVIANRQLWNQSIEHGPLAKRAWVLQERFLAPRTLHFASNQLFWECGQVSCCEMFPFIDLNHTFLPLFFGSALKGHIGTVHWWRTWRSIMEHYSRSLLTKEEDKLFAMAGMATHFHSLTGDKYLAGLWLKGIEKQLLWSSPYGHNSRQQSRSPVNTRPSSYRAPSWSWASLDGPVSCGRWMGEEIDNVSIRVLVADVKVLYEDQLFGDIQHGSLTIECGQLKRTLIQDDQIWLLTKPNPVHLSCTIDVMPVRLSEPIFLLLVDPHSHHFDIELRKRTSLEGLMIIPTHSDGTYERFGHFRIACTPEETREFLSLESYLALPGIEDTEAYERTIPGQGDDELRYVIKLI